MMPNNASQTAPTNESDARILIDDQLRAAGWNPADKSQVLTEVSISGEAESVDETPGPLSAKHGTRARNFFWALMNRPI